MAAAKTVLVVGATGATGKHVVAQLLQKGHTVKTIVRSKDRLLNVLDEIVPNASKTYSKKLEVVEAMIIDLSDEEVKEHVAGCDAVVQCLGHNISFKGMYGKPRMLVRDSAKLLTNAIESTNNSKTKFVMMGSDGVAHPAGSDDKRPFQERLVISIIRALVPPHRDNEAAALYLYKDVAQTSPKVEWTVVRPTDLIDGDASKYVLYDKPKGSLFGGGVTTRANVAQFMVDLLLTDSLWNEHVYKMPVVHDADSNTAADKK